MSHLNLKILRSANLFNL